jgi:hypothetical protein
VYDVHDGRGGRQQLKRFARLVAWGDYAKVDHAWSSSSPRDDLGAARLASGGPAEDEARFQPMRRSRRMTRFALGVSPTGGRVRQELTRVREEARTIRRELAHTSGLQAAPKYIDEAG